MSSNWKWQQTLLDDMSAGLRVEKGVKALILTGSLADDTIEVDEWSDVDLTAIVADDAIADFFTSVSWLERHGELIGLERHGNTDTKTIRVCFAPCKRLDVTLMPESVMRKIIVQEIPATCRPHKRLWSKIPEADHDISNLLPNPIFVDVPQGDITEIGETFWLKASVAIAKTMRYDLLVALHLALDLSRDCLVLQMLRRDQEHGTNIHRIGGFGNDVILRLLAKATLSPRQAILALINRSIQVFDELYVALVQGQNPRAHLMLPALRRAEATCKEDHRGPSGELPVELDRDNGVAPKYE